MASGGSEGGRNGGLLASGVIPSGRTKVNNPGIGPVTPETALSSRTYPGVTTMRPVRLADRSADKLESHEPYK